MGLENQAGSDESYDFFLFLAGRRKLPAGKHRLAWTASFETASVRPIYIMPNTTGHWPALQPPSLLATLSSATDRPARNIPRHPKLVVAVCADTCGRLVAAVKTVDEFPSSSTVLDRTTTTTTTATATATSTLSLSTTHSTRTPYPLPPIAHFSQPRSA